MSFKFNLKSKSKNRFAVRMRSYSMEDKEKAGRPEAPYIEKTLPENEWARYGFTPLMTYQEASEHLKSLNSQTKHRDIQEKKARHNYLESKEKNQLLECAYLPHFIVQAFEDKLKNDSLADNFEKTKFYFHWKTAMKVISELELSPEKWAEEYRLIIKKFKGYARSTIAKLINLLNKYGMFYCKKFGLFFEKLPMPRGKEVGWISEQYSNKTGGRTKEAKGIDLNGMNKLKHSEVLDKEEKNWCVVCLGFGLRPSEVDMISQKEPSKFKIEGNKVEIYQPKLVTLEVKNRYKNVIIKHEFHEEALKIMLSDEKMKKPSLAKIRSILGSEYGLYSFRKGYFYGEQSK